MNLSLAILGGACLSGAFAPMSLWWLAPLGIAIHMYTLKRCARPFLNSFIFAFTFNAIALNWTSIFVGSTPWLILALGQALFFIPLGLCRRFSISFYPLIFLVLEPLQADCRHWGSSGSKCDRVMCGTSFRRRFFKEIIDFAHSPSFFVDDSGSNTCHRRD